MININFAWLTALSVLLYLPVYQGFNQYTNSATIAEQIVGRWYLEEQEMLINGKDINEHFEDLAAQLSASSDHQVDPQMLADKFKKGFKGIPYGTIFTFEDDFSYQIILPDDKTQSGMWRIRNGSDILLQADDQEMLLRVKNLGEDNAVLSIREAKVDSHLGAGGYTVMELVMGLSR